MLLVLLLFSCCKVTLSADELPYVPSDNLAMDCPPSDAPSYFRPNSLMQQNFIFSAVSRIYDIEPHNHGEKPKSSPCIITEQFTYTFPVSIGPKFVRLYFKPITNSGLNISNALFSVSVGQFTLLTTSESSYCKLNSDAGYVVREFCVNTHGHVLNVTFTPSSKISDAYAFFNRIEIVSMPSKLYIQENFPLPLVGQPSHFSMENSTALEMMHRLNVGGDLIPQVEDTGMFRLWTSDVDYFIGDEVETINIESQVQIQSSSLIPAYAAPDKVYASARTVQDKFSGNYTAIWSFPVDFGFYYLVRLHFCEISRRIQKDGQRLFHVYINDQTAEDDADIFHWSHGVGIPIYRDYIINFSKPGEGIKHLSIMIGSKNGSSTMHEFPILNGLEIFKLSDHSGNLAGPFPFGVRNLHQHSAFHEDVHAVELILRVIGTSLFAVSFLLLLRLIFSTFKQQRDKFKQGRSSGYCRIFSIAEIKSATNNFADNLIIGTGGFGVVYKGTIGGGSTRVAIKRANPSSHQGLKEFQTEITMLSELRHHHLVSLIGYSMEKNEMILVYDYMARGTLRDHLYNTQKPPLPWRQRLKICIGAARGLQYLHTGVKSTIIHRDIKSTNILLDDKWVAKVSDFGLSKAAPSPMTQSKTKIHVSTMVKGTFGYLDPEYYRRQKLTEKSDVYSFGVVLFEILCARPAVLPKEEIEEEEYYEKANLAEWALRYCQMGILDQMIDPDLKGKISPECFRTFTDVAKKCLAEKGNERPSMGDVLCNLELSMQQQNAADVEEEMSAKEATGRMNGDIGIVIDDGKFLCSNNSDKTPGVEFSEIMIPIGR
ncbi:hypothetical protein MANES_10G093601v8 [Manihot esculenta]|uniref:Uncharacterized protein n=1 Tax=Manihot esculenta TaxID=3983 RepID=A0ACB7H1E3_MANES|nr:hypothetical protein MANES_10G093601v8 [Manihot esculenta]